MPVRCSDRAARGDRGGARCNDRTSLRTPAGGGATRAGIGGSLVARPVEPSRGRVQERDRSPSRVGQHGSARSATPRKPRADRDHRHGGQPRRGRLSWPLRGDRVGARPKRAGARSRAPRGGEGRSDPARRRRLPGPRDRRGEHRGSASGERGGDVRSGSQRPAPGLQGGRWCVDRVPRPGGLSRLGGCARRGRRTGHGGERFSRRTELRLRRGSSGPPPAARWRPGGGGRRQRPRGEQRRCGAGVIPRQPPGFQPPLRRCGRSRRCALPVEAGPQHPCVGSREGHSGDRSRYGGDPSHAGDLGRGGARLWAGRAPAPPGSGVEPLADPQQDPPRRGTHRAARPCDGERAPDLRVGPGRSGLAHLPRSPAPAPATAPIGPTAHAHRRGTRDRGFEHRLRGPGSAGRRVHGPRLGDRSGAPARVSRRWPRRRRVPGRRGVDCTLACPTPGALGAEHSGGRLPRAGRLHRGGPRRSAG